MVVLLQSNEVFFQPRCLLELYAAANAGIPIMSLVCSDGYDFAAAEDHLLHLETRLQEDLVAILVANNCTALSVANTLSRIGSIITVPLKSIRRESTNPTRAAVTELVLAMQHAKALHVPEMEAWIEDRRKLDAVDSITSTPSTSIAEGSGAERAREARTLSTLNAHLLSATLM